MLLEIYCEKFHQKRVIFHKGLNVVLGTEIGDNSIGKSTFLLIVDFVLGGDTYSSSNDIIQNVGQHDIFFTFSGDGENYYFARNNIEKNIVWKCNKDYGKITRLDIADYRNWLNSYYKLDLPSLNFRDAVGRYIRVYGKENCNEKRPLSYVNGEKPKKAKYALLKLFNFYSIIEDVAKQAALSSDRLKAYKKAQALAYIDKIGKREYERNVKEISKLESELSCLSDNLEKGLLDCDAVISEKALNIKSDLSKARRMRSNIVSKLKSISDNYSYEFSLSKESIEELKRFFPDANIDEIAKIENFHNQISQVFKEELQELHRQLTLELSDINHLIEQYEAELKDLIQNPNLSKNILRKHAELLKEIDRLKCLNERFIQLEQLKENKVSDEKRLREIEIEQFTIMANQINAAMEQINDSIYSGKANAPLISFEKDSYNFFTPNDTGTGRSYKGLIVFDLAVASLTKLPLIVHDSIVLKQIADDALERILSLYMACGKQVIISLDKQTSYSNDATNMLINNKILELGPNGNELFGKSWG